MAHAVPANAAALQTIYTFPSSESGGATVVAGLATLNGKFYGVANGGSHGAGIIFEYDPATKTEQTVYTFTGGATDGAQPASNLTVYGSKLYGTALSGAGATSGGSAFAFDPATKTLTLLHGFTNTTGNQGYGPFAPLNYSDGYFYGTTQYGGVADAGTIYRLSPTGQYKLLFQFPQNSDGCDPFSGVALYDGVIFGTTSGCGPNNDGNVYSFNLSTSTETVLHNFEQAQQSPEAGLLTYYNGYLYGPAEFGGAQSSGFVFQVNAATGAYKEVHAFSGGDGQNPISALTPLNGLLYGSTSAGGTAGEGTLYSLDPKTDVLATVADFGTATDFTQPFGSLLVSNGSIYG